MIFIITSIINSIVMTVKNRELAGLPWSDQSGFGEVLGLGHSPGVLLLLVLKGEWGSEDRHHYRV